MSNNRRRLDSSAIVALVPVVVLLPIWLVAIGIIWLPLKVTTDVSYWFFALMAMLFGVVLFSRPVQRLVFVRMLGARAPSSQELNVLEPAWRIVAQANHLSPSRFVLAVVDSFETNAFACGGHLLVVSSDAISNFDQAELTGVLAHELSHHMGGHTVALTITQWMSVPIIALAHAGLWLRDFGKRATTSAAAPTAAVSILVGALTTILTALSFALISGLNSACALSSRIGRASEYRADARALQMGFGHELLSALKQVAAKQKPSTKTVRPLVTISSHPPAATRVAKLEAMLKRDVAHKTRPRRHRQDRWR
ncbi:MAG: hypothetical protein D4R44_03360 [Actinobacteria bacterium]|nr:MAG: hypothetical protein D4R44_03360 [Actinomycetota bacterium]